MHISIAVLVVLAVTNLALAGTTDPDKAAETLSKEGYELTPEAFVESVDDGEVKIVELFLAAGIEPNSKDKRGKSAIHHAAEYADGVMTTMLIEAGADVNVTTEKGDTPLCDAADEEAHGSVAALIAGGADVNTVCDWGKTALHTAADERDAVTVKMLLDAGASPEVGDRRGDAPLVFAAMRAGYGVPQLRPHNSVTPYPAPIHQNVGPDTYPSTSTWTEEDAAVGRVTG